MTFYDLYKKLSECYPDELRCDWDNDGIMCADSLDKEVKKVLISLDVTMDTVNYACANGFDTIVSHHPLVFRSQSALTPLSYTQAKLIRLVKSGVRVMSFHTRLDASNGGVNDVLASAIDLKNVHTDASDPIGRIGYLEKAMPIYAFAKKVKNALSSPIVLFSGRKAVSKVYVVGGDGKDLIESAIANGCDTLVTGRASYNTSVDAEDLGINIIEAGHFYTENPVCLALEEKIKLFDEKIVTGIFNSNSIKYV